MDSWYLYFGYRGRHGEVDTGMVKMMDIFPTWSARSALDGVRIWYSATTFRYRFLIAGFYVSRRGWS
jgi:hypothetical protein